MEAALGQPGERLELERVEEADATGLLILDFQPRAVARAIDAHLDGRELAVDQIRNESVSRGRSLLIR
jgi:hypothetical protein